MTTANNAAAKLSIGSVWSRSLSVIDSSLAAVENTAKAAENLTGIVSDKAENFRSQIAIADTMKHDQLMAQLKKQAEDLGIDLESE